MVPHEWLPNHLLRMRYPQFNVSRNFVGLLDNGGGILKAERAMQAMLVNKRSYFNIISTLPVHREFREISKSS